MYAHFTVTIDALVHYFEQEEIELIQNMTKNEFIEIMTDLFSNVIRSVMSSSDKSTICLELNNDDLFEREFISEYSEKGV